MYIYIYIYPFPADILNQNNMKVIPMKFILSMIFIKQRLIIDIAYISNL